MKRRMNEISILTVSALLLIFSCGFLEFVFDEAHEGNDAFARGKYDQAAKQYTEAQISDPTQKVLDYNLGAALYKQGKHEDSLTAFRKAYNDDNADLVADAHYNAGNALFMQKKLDEAIVEYTEALKIRPDDEDAKFNLELARRLLQQHEDQEKQDKDQQNQDQQQDQQQCDNPQDQKQDQQDQQDQQGQQEKPEEQKKEEEKAGAKDEQEKKEDQPKEEQAAAAREKEDMKELTPEQAARILDSLKKDELDEIAKQLLPGGGSGNTDKDW